MSTEELLGRINEGRHAQICLDWMGPLLDQLEKNNIAQLKNAYRSGKYSEVILASGVASLCTLEDLRSKLDGMVRGSQSAQKQLETEKVNEPREY